MNRNNFFFVIYFVFFSAQLIAQSYNFFLDRDKLLPYYNYLNNKEALNHTGIKPFLSSEMNAVVDSIRAASKKGKLNFPDAREFGTNDSSKYKSEISVSPILVVEEGVDFNLHDDEMDYATGAVVLANYKEKFALNINFISGFSSFPSYVDSLVKLNNVYPGIGRLYYKENGFHSWQQYSGYFSFSPNKIFNFQLGQGKHFWGDGYRSLFLSDNASPYPFLKITTNIRKIKYVSMFTMMTDAVNGSTFKKDLRKKYGTFHILSLNVSKRVNLNLFESIMWQGTDTNHVRNFDVNYLNPVIFFRPVEYSVGSSDNAFLGFGYKIKVAKHQQFYGQFLLDEFLLSKWKKDISKLINPDDTVGSGWWANKQAYQFGFRSFDLFTVKNLDFQTEVNIVRPYTYAHGSVQQNYGHLNQSLAHPLGANFKEWISLLNYRYKDFLFEAKYVRVVRGADTSGLNYGGNIFLSYFPPPNEFGNKIGQGLKINISTVGFRVSYFFRPMNSQLEVGFNDRRETSKQSSRHTPYIYFGFRSYFGNLYSDY